MSGGISDNDRNTVPGSGFIAASLAAFLESCYKNRFSIFTDNYLDTQGFPGGISMVNAPDIAFSTVEERREYIRKRYPCIADCDMCGLCKVFHGHDAEYAFEDYISGKRQFMDVAADYKR